tara:strand:+ start:584 stop:745 length:162 start_codon:yes stop_codon:yes gene_type:complete
MLFDLLLKIHDFYQAIESLFLRTERERQKRLPTQITTGAVYTKIGQKIYRKER